MNTILRKVDVDNIDMEVIKEASDILHAGDMVAFPTETVYGLGADALDEKASKKIYAAKGRPSDNPLIVHVANEQQILPLVKEIPESARKLMKAFWPGPLTIIFNKSDVVPYGTTGGLDTVAIRMPNHKVALTLIEESNIPIAAPSANTSGRPSPTTAMHVMDDLNGKISMVIDGGAVGIGIESTIVDVTGDIPMILRPGYINKKMLEEVVGEVTIDKAILGPVSPDLKPKAPGMKYKHYAPKADFTMFDGDIDKVADRINELAESYIKKGYKVGIISSAESKDRYRYGEVISIGSRNNELSISKNLYKVLREFDDKQVDYILGETFRSEELGQAIMNRLLKAAGYQVETVI
ncbi:MAG: threonylcarbamoyl-AMP synthase [Clostridiales bacterium]|jgi:L-threonylcarbamoyladenylate synthase|uniref:L-threonylcarbamoyladenylate synthase n=1 Tax=Bovifimicola ammoniilytica TaxID=2981720 RepID=UPI00082051BE|nr:L-threonylcarbamoyladenylate synthase [Bovifimicola ammoniilytica]MBD8942319.1 threonylcarbamoyl-AMP synthase [Clostridiales bacterium]MCU6754110.1 L-threonylcarbamoyladenylate synthase [Bovifimicola ammoniilytica]SCJ80402.1 t(6)A37 threonylcarbamoyladenosine biosynthesis protein RimN [uncultured Eubacterium sp.]